jgi:hypothetical protein
VANIPFLADLEESNLRIETNNLTNRLTGENVSLWWFGEWSGIEGNRRSLGRMTGTVSGQFSRFVGHRRAGRDGILLYVCVRRFSPA